MPVDEQPSRHGLEALADEIAAGLGPHCPILNVRHYGSGLLGIGATTAEDARELARVVHYTHPYGGMRAPMSKPGRPGVGLPAISDGFIVMRAGASRRLSTPTAFFSSVSYACCQSWNRSFSP